MASTQSVCGDFVEPTFIDYGQCNPRRLKRDCRNHVPTVPGWQDEPPASGECVDENAVAVFEPAETPPNRTHASLLDENCEPVLDENNQPILGAVI